MNNSKNIKKKNLEIINKIVKERIDFGNIYSTLEDIDKSEICVLFSPINSWTQI